MQETDVKALFRWPALMMDELRQHLPAQGGKPLQVQMFSEFSGAGTAEFAMSALAAAAPGLLSCVVVRQGDWSSAAETALINNAQKDTHIFSDIEDISSVPMKSKTSRRVAVEAPRLESFLGSAGGMVCSALLDSSDFAFL